MSSETNPAQLRPPPTEPPTLCSREEQQQWFADLRVWNAEITQHAVGIVQKYFAGAGLEMRKELEKSNDWNGFALYLSLALGPVIDRDPESEWVKALIAELVEFSLLNPSGSPEARLAQLLSEFTQWDLKRRWAFQKLLPEKAKPALELIREWEAEEQRRIDEAYY